MKVARQILKFPVLIYRYGISPLLPPRCRFQPTCSEYTLEALEIHGALRGSALAAKRVLRCHPWGGHGYDPVPPLTPPLTETGDAEQQYSSPIIGPCCNCGHTGNHEAGAKVSKFG